MSLRELAWLGAGLLALTVLTLWSLRTGAADIALHDVLAALWTGGEDRAALVLREVRLPRVLAALLCGAALAVAGTIIQAMTGNPLADPGILGINAGAALAVVLGLAVFGVDAMGALVALAWAGAALAALLVLALASAGRAGGSPVRLVLSGVVIASFCAALTATVLVLDARTQDVVRLWTVGSVQGRSLDVVAALAPTVLVPLVLALLVNRQIAALSLGAAVARGIGQAQTLWRLMAAGVVVALAGSAVAIAGPLGFVGLIVPHMARLLVGAEQHRLLPAAAMGGAALTLIADTLPRALWSRDVPVGVTLALIGAPVFVWLARRGQA